MAWHLRPPQPNYISSEQPRYQKPFDQLTPSAFSTPSISTSPQGLPVFGQGMIPKVADSAPRKRSVRFPVTGRRDSGNGVSKVTWCLTLHEERPKAVSMRIAHGGCGSGELENSSVWWVDISQASIFPASRFLEAGGEVWLGLTTWQWVVSSLSDSGQLFCPLESHPYHSSPTQPTGICLLCLDF